MKQTVVTKQRRQDKRLVKSGKRSKRIDPAELAVTQIKQHTKNGKKRTLAHVTHGAFLFVRCYYANQLDRRSSLGQFVADTELDFAVHCGFRSYPDCPVTIREKIRLAVGQILFQQFYTPSESTYAHLKSSENLLNRLTSELGLSPKPREVSLKEHVEKKLKAKRRRTED